MVAAAVGLWLAFRYLGPFYLLGPGALLVLFWMIFRDPRRQIPRGAPRPHLPGITMVKTVTTHLVPFANCTRNNGTSGLSATAQNKECSHTPVFEHIKQVPRQARARTIIIT